MPALSWETLCRLEIPLTEMVAGRIGLIHDFFLTFPYEVRNDLPDGDRDLVVLADKSTRKRRIQELAEYPGRVVVVFAPGDAPLRSVYLGGERGLPPNVVAAYATNNELADRRVTSVPLGVRANKLRPLQFVRQNHTGARTGLLYGNFTLNDRHYRPDKEGAEHIRHGLARRLRDAPWANLDVYEEQRDTPQEHIHYYSEIAGHRFVLSPEGNGIDCYRTWEILYLGAIPVVMVSTSMSAFADLPILFTEDYEELSEEYLERRWREMSGRTFQIERMLRSYYLHHFLTTVSTLEEPRFVCCWSEDDANYNKFRSVLRRSSRSAGDAILETPTAPFGGRRDPLSVESWTVSGGLRLERSEDGLTAAVGAGKGGGASLRLQTIVGGPFRLTGAVQPADGDRASLLVSLRDGLGVLASATVPPGEERSLRLDFVARSERTELVIDAEGDRGSSWRLGELSLSATV